MSLNSSNVVREIQSWKNSLYLREQAQGDEIICLNHIVRWVQIPALSPDPTRLLTLTSCCLLVTGKVTKGSRPDMNCIVCGLWITGWLRTNHSTALKLSVLIYKMGVRISPSGAWEESMRMCDLVAGTQEVLHGSVLPSCSYDAASSQGNVFLILICGV